MKVGHKSPDFTCKAVENGKIVDFVSTERFQEKWNLLFFYPLDFTFVCPTEIIEFSKRSSEFQKRGCNVFGASVDSEFSHLKWIQLSRQDGGLGGSLNIPLISDFSKEVSSSFDALNVNGLFTNRVTVLIDPQGVIRYHSVLDTQVGRSVDEAMRVLDAFLFVKEHGQMCPINWKKGDKGIAA